MRPRAPTAPPGWRKTWNQSLRRTLGKWTATIHTDASGQTRIALHLPAAATPTHFEDCLAEAEAALESLRAP